MTHWPPGDGEMAGRIRALDWSATPLGPIAGWPQSLKVAARLLLNTRHPMFIWWGPELIQLYNDAYRETMGWEKHPSALGSRGRDTWAEIWEVIGPQIAQVMGGGPATWHEDQLVPVTRHGSREDVWWTYSFSPINDETAPDGVGGVMVICRDVTAEHRAKRTAQENEARYRELFEAMEEGYLVADVIFDADGRAVDIAYHQANPAATRMVGTDVTGRRLREIDPAYEEYWYETFGRVARTGVSEQGVLYASPGAIWYDFHVSRLPTSDPTSTRIAILFFDASLRVRTELALRESEERQAYLLRLSDALRPIGDPTEIQRIAIRMLGEHLKASRVFYVVVGEDGDTATILVDYTDGVPSRIGRYSLSAFSSFAVGEWRAGRIANTSDVDSDPRYSEAERTAYASVATRAGFGIPLIKDGRLVALLGINQSSPRHWTGSDIDVAGEIAERTWAAVERASAEGALRVSEEKYRTVFESMDEGLLIHEMIRNEAGQVVDYRLLEANPAHQRATGLSRELIGRLGSEFMPEVEPHWLELFHRVSTSGIAERAEMYNAPTSRWYNVQVSPVRGHDRIAIVFDDVTPRKRAEAALRESEERFQQFARASTAGLWIRDAGTLAMEFVSSAIATIYGVDADALLGDVERWASMIAPEDRKVALEHLQEAREGQIVVHEFRIRRPSDGATRWIRNTDFPLRDDGHIPRIGGIAEDVTDAKRAAERQDVLVAELQHRTRNLLAVVRGVASDTMRETGPTEAFRGAFSDRLSALSRVQGLLSRSDAEPITIGSLLRLELDALGAGAAGDRVTIAGPEVFLRPSTVQTLALALHELATNARKYGALSHEGGRLAVTWRKRSEAGERRLAIAWVETGLEQAPERLPSERQGGGYGRELIERALPHALGARTSYALSASGVRCTIDLAVRPGRGEP